MLAVGLACQSLRRKDINLALVCGVNLLLRPYEMKPPFHAADGRCKTFDSSADGYGRAEGCGVLILKRLKDALKDGDNIRGIIRGYGAAQEGPSRSLGTPTIEVEALCMKLALKDASMQPCQVSYIEAHGTGTAVGDPMEISAIQRAYKHENRITPLIIGSVKTNVGHMESAAGIGGVIKTILMFENEIVPQHLNLHQINPKINLGQIPAVLPLLPMPWPRKKDKRRIAGVNSFGLAGTDTHLILEEASIPQEIISTQASSRFHVLTFSARSENSLTQMVDSCLDYLKRNPANLEDFAFTWNSSRAKFKEFRAGFVCKHSCDFLETLEKNPVVKTKALQISTKPKLCFLFSGQGSEFLEMGKDLYDTHPLFRLHFDSINSTLINEFSIDIREALFYDSVLLTQQKPTYAHMCIFAIQYGLAKVWMSWGFCPDIVLGHSLGEYVAAVIANILSAEDATRLLATRAMLISDLPERGKMIVVKRNKFQTTLIVREFEEESRGLSSQIEIAAVNSSKQTTLAGSEKSICDFKSFCDSRNIPSVVLDSSSAIHSSIMDPILPQFRAATKKITTHLPNCTFISSSLGQEVESFDADYFVKATRDPINFLDAALTVRKLSQETPIVFIDIGPQQIISELLKTNFQENNFTPLLMVSSLLKNKSSWKTLQESLLALFLSGFDINWIEFYRFNKGRRISGLPTYPFQRKAFWFPVSDKDLEKTSSQAAQLGGIEMLNHHFVHGSFQTPSLSKVFYRAFL